MCGLAGFVGPGDTAVARAMGEAIRHRGPDGEGFAVDAGRGLHLVHRRLAVVDLAGGTQPMWNAERTTCVLFNGEIYNHMELRAELQARGRVFTTDHSDTEVLVHGYAEWGESLPGLLNGMFAFAVYDAARGRLFLARDRFGKKPLYYHVAPGLFAFGSELSALKAHPGVPRRIDRRSLQKLFAYGFIPSPRSLYSDVARLPAGHTMTFDLARPGRVELHRYWDFRIEPPDTIPAKPEEAWGEELRHLLQQAVRRRLMSDVPLGVFLSGGIDSAAILAYATREAAGRVQTFSIGFREPTFDESGFARAAAAHFHSEHHEQILEIDRARELIPGVLARLDEPLGDPSIVPTYQLCAFARERITVALGGDGGDELFAGYDPFKALAVARWYRALVPSWMRGGIRRLADLLPVSDANMSLDFRIKRGLRGAAFAPELWNPAWLGPLDASEIGDLFQEPIAVDELYEEAITTWEATGDKPIVDKTLEFYTRLYLPEDILVKADRASMMVSLELRSPFLDPDVVDFARRIPHQYKYRKGRTKVLLRSALRGVVPEDILERRKKGFGIPLTKWLRHWDAAPIEQGGAVVGNVAAARALLEAHKAGRSDHRLALWCLLALAPHAEEAS